MEAGLAVLTGDLPAGAPPARALESVRLLLLAGDAVLRALEAAEAAEAATCAGAAGTVLARLGTHCSPVAVTPDELGAAWQGGRVQLPLAMARGGRAVGPMTLAEGRFHVGQLLAQAARTRALGAGTLVFCGPAGASDTAGGAASLADQRAAETLADGQARTTWLQPGDRLRVEAKGADGRSVWGAIDFTVVAAEADA